MNITQEKQDFLAIINKLSTEKYIDDVNASGKEKFSSEEENARMRKMMKCVVDILVARWPDLAKEKSYQEFMEYYVFFENTKANIKERLRIKIKEEEK